MGLRLILKSAAILVLMLSLVSNSTATSDPVTVVTKLNDTLESILHNADELDYNGRYELLEPVVQQVFDFPGIARIAVGRTWKTLDEEQQEEFLDIFTKLSTATFASQFNSTSDDNFEFISKEELKKERVLVRTKLADKDGNGVSFDYIVHPVNGDYRIINVIADGVSDLSLKRAEYSSIIKDQGYEALVTQLRLKLDRYSETGEV